MVAGVCLAAAAVLAAAGCSSGNAAAAAPQAGSVSAATIKVLVNVTPTLTTSFWSNEVAQFEKKYPSIKVTLENQGGEDLDTYFSSLVSSGNAPDVAEGLSGISSLAKDGVLAAFPKQSWITSQSQWQSQTVSGQIYAPSAGLQADSLIYYNESDFAKAGITTPPTSMAQLASDVTELKSKGIAPFQSGSQFVTGTQLEFFVDPTLFEQNPNWFANRNANKVTFASSYWQTMLTTYQSWVHDGDFAQGTLSTPYAQSETNFLKGSAAMYVLGDFVTPTVDSTPHSFNVGVFAVPTESGKSALAVAPTYDFSIMKSSPHYADDLAFAKFMETDPAVAANFLRTDGDYSAYTPPVTYQQSALSEQIQKLVDSSDITLTPCCTGSGDNSAPTEFSDELTQEVQGLFTGSSTPAQITSTLDSWWAREQG
jgi:multiple sugar transport system substrate-binding protein/raffinose/stachyose/melibiose transport system substrate-binding protein